MLIALLAVDLVRYARHEPPPQPEHPLLPTFVDVDSALAAELRKGEWNEAIHARLRERGPEGALMLFRYFSEKYREPQATHSRMMVPDVQQWPAADLMGELADGRVRRLLERAMGIQEYDSDFRLMLTVALCRPKHAASLDALTARLLDRQESNEFRCDLLRRLPRLGTPAPPRLRELLYQPFDGLDIATAGTLARMGDPEAPSLVLAGLKLRSYDYEVVEHLAYAVERLTRADLHLGREKLNANHQKVARRLAGELEEWMQTAPATEFERVPRARLTLNSFDDILAAGDSFDLAEAVMLMVGSKPEYRLHYLQQIENLAAFLRRKLDGVQDPRARVGVLSDWCLARHRDVPSHVVDAGMDSYVHIVMREDCGNCVGYSTLYLALARRLGIPLHGVFSPFHCFVRYDDGAVRFNVETTDGGAVRDDDKYVTADDLAHAPRVVEKGLFLTNRTRREVLAAVVSNHAAELVAKRKFERGRKAAEQAIMLDGKHYLAYVNLWAALYDLGEDAAALRALDHALELWSGNAPALRKRGYHHLTAGRLATARADFERSLAIEDRRLTVAWLARCLARAGEPKKALRMVRKELRDDGGNFALRLAEAEALLRSGAGGNIARAMQARTKNPDSYVEVAKILVAMGKPRRALAVLRDVKRKPTHMHRLVRALAHHESGDTAAARAELEKADKMATPGHYARHVRRRIEADG